MTNGDKIRQMSNEELAEFLEKETTCYCRLCFYKLTGYDKRGICGERCIEGIKAYLDMEVEDEPRESN